MTDLVGFACAYTPLPLLHAAGLTPHRILPLGDAPDQAGALLHDNLCPHVKRLLDRALAGDLPDLAGVVLMASCETMRRLADAWAVARPADRLTLVDLPTGRDAAATRYLAGTLAELRGTLGTWTGRPVTDADLTASVALYNDLAAALAVLASRSAAGTLPGGRVALQRLLLAAVTGPPERALATLRELQSAQAEPAATPMGVPVYLFGNVLPDPEALALFADCGARVVADDLCTGTKQVLPVALDTPGDLLGDLARALLARPPCARTLDAHRPLGLADDVVAAVRGSGARGVVAHVMKFCDPYLARLPAVRAALREAGIPLLALEGAATLRSLGQHRTRIEAFVEMLEEARR
jgi:benzoyl-CoA reductase/2-hydroxyglutaryl-CoA dehydratase subunit BcrC/BadD/HgdB